MQAHTHIYTAWVNKNVTESGNNNQKIQFIHKDLGAQKVPRNGAAGERQTKLVVLAPKDTRECGVPVCVCRAVLHATYSLSSWRMAEVAALRRVILRKGCPGNWVWKFCRHKRSARRLTNARAGTQLACRSPCRSGCFLVPFWYPESCSDSAYEAGQGTQEQWEQQEQPGDEAVDKSINMLSDIHGRHVLETETKGEPNP